MTLSTRQPLAGRPWLLGLCLFSLICSSACDDGDERECLFNTDCPPNATCEAGSCQVTDLGDGDGADAGSDMDDAGAAVDEPDGDDPVCEPSDEVCDGLDNDCDGQIDGEDPDLSLATCPDLDGALPQACAQGACVYICADGSADLNEDLSDGPAGDGCECATSNSGVEICDGLDNDCNGAIDDAPLQDLIDACPDIDGALPQNCTDGACVYACLAGNVDINEDLSDGSDGDGCECATSNSGVEICDGLDNDCNGAIDDAPLQDLIDACPDLDGAQAQACTDGACIYACLAGSVDINDDLDSAPDSDGCECTFSNARVEICDGLDNDCNGDTDEGPLEVLLDSCPELDGALPQACNAGRCEYACEPGRVDVNLDLNDGPDSDGCECTTSNNRVEICDGLDNDCNGDIDDGPPQDLLDSCPELDGARPQSCVAGRCGYFCEPGRIDINLDLDAGLDGNGCECTLSNNQVEICDGLDNDCDGDIDDQDDDFVAVLCELQEGACEDATALCVNGVLQACNADRYLDLNASFTGTPESLEVVCDGEDNNCDGTVDEVCCQPGQGDVSLAAPLSNLSQHAPSIAVNDDGTRIMVAWQEARVLEIGDSVPSLGVTRYALFNRAGRLINGTLTDINGGNTLQNILPQVVWNGERFVLAYITSANGVSLLSWRTIDEQGDTADSGIFPSFVANVGELHLQALDNGEVMAFWSQNGDCTLPTTGACIKKAIIQSSPQIEEVSRIFFQSSIESRGAAMAQGLLGSVMTWSEKIAGSVSLTWRRFDTDNEPFGEQFTLALSTDTQARTTVMNVQLNYLIGYIDTVNGVEQVFTQLIRPNGTPIGDPVQVSAGTQDKSFVRLTPTSQGPAIVYVDGGSSRFLFQSLDDDGRPLRMPVNLLSRSAISFESHALQPLEDGATLWVNCSANNIDTRLTFNILSPDGARLCFDP